MQQRTFKKKSSVNKKHRFFYKSNTEEEIYLTDENIMSFLSALEYSLTHPNMTLEKIPILLSEEEVISPKNKITVSNNVVTITTNMLEAFPREETFTLNGIKGKLSSCSPALMAELETYLAPLSPEKLLNSRDKDIPSLTSLCLFYIQMQLVLDYLEKIFLRNNTQESFPALLKTRLLQSKEVVKDARNLPEELQSRLKF